MKISVRMKLRRPTHALLEQAETMAKKSREER
jgi:hypothetical protein